MKTSVNRQYNRKWLAFLCIPLAFLLTGCIKLDMALTVNKDKTVSGNVVFAMADSLVALGSDPNSSNGLGINGIGGLFDTKSKGITVAKYHEGGFTGEKFTFDHAPLTAFASSVQKNGSFGIDVKGNIATISGALDLSTSNSQATDATSPFGEAFSRAMLSSAQIRIAVTFPGKVIKSTGVISKDGHTVTWIPSIGEKTDLTTTASLDSPMNFIPWAIGGLLLIALVSWLTLINRKKKTPIPSSGEQEMPTAEGEGEEFHNI